MKSYHSKVVSIFFSSGVIEIALDSFIFRLWFRLDDVNHRYGFVWMKMVSTMNVSMFLPSSQCYFIFGMVLFNVMPRQQAYLRSTLSNGEFGPDNQLLWGFRFTWIQMYAHRNCCVNIVLNLVDGALNMNWYAESFGALCKTKQPIDISSGFNWMGDNPIRA